MGIPWGILEYWWLLMGLAGIVLGNSTSMGYNQSYPSKKPDNLAVDQGLPASHVDRTSPFQPVRPSLKASRMEQIHVAKTCNCFISQFSFHSKQDDPVR